MMTLLYIFLALIGISFLVFIHELGHYLVARREKMKVEVFSIGMGKPLISWYSKGVKWQICPLLFGGYVKIAGMEPTDEIKQGKGDEFYSKGPLSRIKVLLAGPVVNLAFALIAFTAIWLMGGRHEPFAKYTKIIGAMDPKSELYQKGVLPGDELKAYNDKQYGGYKDLLTRAVIHEKEVNLELYKVGYFSGKKDLVDYQVSPYQAKQFGKGFQTVGILTPASYLIMANKAPISEKSPLAGSGMEVGDRVVWVDGELIFSQAMFSQALNDPTVFVAIKREGKQILGRIPRLALEDIRLSQAALDEVQDWSYAAYNRFDEASLKWVPYVLDEQLRVEKEVSFIGSGAEFMSPSHYVSNREVDLTLKPGDQIVMVDGMQVTSPAQFFKQLQTKRVQVIVERDASLLEPALWVNEDEAFLHRTNWKQLLPLVGSLGEADSPSQSGQFVKLNPITPVKLRDFAFSGEQQKRYNEGIREQKKAIASMSNADEKLAAEKALDKMQNQLVVGAQFKDREVIYNPGPFTLFRDVTDEIGTTLGALFSGKTNPKHMGGPLLVVNLIQKSMGVSFKEALFWLGAISLNLGLLNLLPLPVLDGGRITIAAIEGVRGKPLKASTINFLMVPCAVLLIGFFVFVTYQDIFRLLGW